MSEFHDIYGPWALVTGASSGIGRALSLALAKNGLNIALVSNETAALDAVAEEISQNTNAKTRCIVADLSDEAGLQVVQSQCSDLEVGFFVASAGIEVHGEYVNIPIEDQLRLIDVNIRSTMVLTQFISNNMKTRGRGGVLLVSSMAGSMANPYLASYAGSKAFITNFGHSLRYELKRHGVDVSVLAPGPTKTPMLERLGGGINLEKAIMPITSAEFVAKCALRYFPNKPLIVPDWRNRVLIFLAVRVLPIRWVIKLSGDMMRKIGGGGRKAR